MKPSSTEPRAARPRTVLSHRAAGTTLLELVVVLAVLGVLMSIVGLDLGRTRWSAVAAEHGAPAAIEQAVRASVSTGVPITVTVDAPSGPASVTALPDGRVLGGEALGLDPLTGR